jgi:RNA polymerase sigma-70 factor (ECF subfamily)
MKTRTQVVAGLTVVLMTGLGLARGVDLPGPTREVGTADTVDGDLKKLQGTWYRVSSKLDDKEWGNGLPPEDIRLQVVFKDDDWFGVDKDGKGLTKCHTIRIDPSKTPKEIDVLDSKGQKTITVGIYKIEGGTLTLCQNIGSKRRPTEFTSKPDGPRETVVLDVYKRKP